MRQPAFLPFKKETLEACLAEWQAVLRLQDWRIRIELTRRIKLDAIADISHEPQFKEAILRIADPVDATEEADRDLEHSIVHELLHLHWRFYAPPKGAENDEYEAAINLTAGALVSLKRGSRNA